MDEQQLIRESRQLAGQVLSGRKAASTLRQYRRTYARIRSDSRPLCQQANNRRTYYGLRAALAWGLATDIRAALNARDRARKAGDEAAQVEAAGQIRRLYADLRELDVAHGASPEEMLQRESSWEPAPPASGASGAGAGRKGASKRAGLNQLPSDWRERVWRRMGKWKNHVAVLSVAGVRPSEACSGVRITRQGDNLVITVKGAKHDPGRGKGHEWRRIAVAVESPEARHLAQLVNHAPPAGEGIEIEADPDPVAAGHRLSQSIRNAGRKLGFKPPLSAYSFRHALASDLKAAGAREDQIAAALGHASTSTQTLYGLRRYGGGRGQLPVMAESSGEIRRPDRRPQRLRQHPRSSGGSLRNHPGLQKR